MTKDYSDFRVWKEVELWKIGREYLQEHEGYSLNDVYNICNRLMQVGYEEGLEGCFLKFESHMESYEDYLGPPSITVCGYRRLNEREVAEVEREDMVNDLAKEKGITPHEARNLLDLVDKGVVKL